MTSDTLIWLIAIGTPATAALAIHLIHAVADFATDIGEQAAEHS